MPTIYLFDIDGTLVDGAGAGRTAMHAAFGEVVGDDAALANVSFSGMTDRAIVREGLHHAAFSGDHDATIDEVVQGYLARLPEALRSARGYRVHPGVLAILDHLATFTEVAIGLGTGNVELGARIKLDHFGERERFAFGGYGSDHELRAELLACGARRGAERLGCAMDACAIWVIGDTPLDVRAAQAIGASCLAVATGRFSEIELERTGADVVVADLDDARARACLCETAR